MTSTFKFSQFKGHVYYNLNLNLKASFSKFAFCNLVHWCLSLAIKRPGDDGFELGVSDIQTWPGGIVVSVILMRADNWNRGVHVAAWAFRACKRCNVSGSGFHYAGYHLHPGNTTRIHCSLSNPDFSFTWIFQNGVGYLVVRFPNPPDNYFGLSKQHIYIIPFYHTDH